MTHEIEISLICKVKEFLQITDDLSSIELLHLLKDHRKRIHPDKFTDEKAKKEAEAKFKEIGALIEELDRFIQNEKLNRGAKELALYEPLYDNAILQSELEEAIEKIKSLEETISAFQRENDDLKKSLEKKQNLELEKEAAELKLLYKPSSHKIASLGIMFLLTLALAIMAKIESVYQLIIKYSPFEEVYLKTSIFVIFIVMLFVVAKQYIENRLLVRRTSEVCSPLFCKSFLSYIDSVHERESNKPRIFTESDALAFIAGEGAKLKNILSILGFRMYQIGTHEKLKNYFINMLLNKKLINILHASDLDRVFSVREEKPYHYWQF